MDKGKTERNHRTSNVQIKVFRAYPLSPLMVSAQTIGLLCVFLDRGPLSPLRLFCATDKKVTRGVTDRKTLFSDPLI